MQNIFNKYNRNGFVVVFVLCAIIALEVILFVFNNNSRAGLREGQEFKNSQQAYLCAQSGINIAMAYIRDGTNNSSKKNINELCARQKVFEVGKGKCSIALAPESSKININLLINKNGRLDRTRIDQLLRLIDLLNQRQDDDLRISYGLVPSIIDWIDKNDNVTTLPFVRGANSGAESDYYNQLAPSYVPANSRFNSLEELLLVKYMTPAIFESIRDYLTVYGDNRIDINHAPRLVIESLSEQMSSVLAQLIINRRKLSPFENIMDLQDVPGMTENIYQMIKQAVTVNPKEQYFTVISRGNVSQCRRQIYAVLNTNSKSQNIEVAFYKEL